MVQFENWIINHKSQIATAAYGLFEDSLRCMKFDIVRPAYLMAYQGMLRHLRDVIVFSTPPSSFDAAAWKDVKKGLT